MQKFLLTLLFALLADPSVSLAAFNDVTLAPDVVINVASINLNVSGASAVIESIVVGASSFDIVLQSGSSVTVASSDRRTFTLSPSSGFTSSTSCDSSQSTLTLSGTGSVTVTITPTSSTCTVASSGGGVGGSVFLQGTLDKPTGPFSVVINSGSAVTKTRDVTLKLQAGSNVKSMAISSQKADLSDAALVDYQPTATWDLCSKLGGLVRSPEAECKEGLHTIYVRFYTRHGQPSETYSDTIEYRKSGIAVTGPQITANLFTRALSVGSTGEDVKLLQKILNSLGFIITNSGIGSPGNETAYFGGLTMKAVGKFQEAHGIASPNTTGYGRVGTKTLTKLQELAKIPSQDSILSSVSASPNLLTSNRRLSLGMTGDDVKRLQQLLNKSADTQIASTGIGSPSNETTYFGSLTEKAVQKFQIKHGVVSSGTDQTSGFGAVGSKTQAKLQEVFGR